MITVFLLLIFKSRHTVRVLFDLLFLYPFRDVTYSSYIFKLHNKIIMKLHFLNFIISFHNFVCFFVLFAF